MMGIKLVDSGMVIKYQVDECTCTSLAECHVAQSHIYPRFMYKVSALTNFTIELGCKDYSFLDQAIEYFEQGI